ncbi:hypothetical protein L873DRAFT_1927730, partial [Choiromyces venosus 120613-1]
MYPSPTISRSISPNPSEFRNNGESYTFTSSLNGWKYVILPEPITGQFACFCCRAGFQAPDGKALGRHIRAKNHIDPSEWMQGYGSIVVYKPKDTASVVPCQRVQIKPTDCSNSHGVSAVTDLRPRANSIDLVAKHSSATGCPERGNNPTELSIPEGQTYDLLDDNLDWTLDWLSSDLKFSESATVGLPDLEEQTNLQWLHQLPGPNKEETLDNLTKVEV